MSMSTKRSLQRKVDIMENNVSVLPLPTLEPISLQYSRCPANTATPCPRTPIQARNEQHLWVQDQITIYLSVEPRANPTWYDCNGWERRPCNVERRHSAYPHRLAASAWKDKDLLPRRMGPAVTWLIFHFLQFLNRCLRLITSARLTNHRHSSSHCMKKLGQDFYVKWCQIYIYKRQPKHSWSK